MNRRTANWLFVLVVFLAAGLLLAQTSVLQAAPGAPKGKIVRPTAIHAVQVGVSKPMRGMKPAEVTPHDPHNLRELDQERRPNPFLNATKPHDALVQKTAGSKTIPGPIVNVDGVGDVNGVQPADTTMDISDDTTNQIIQWVNLSYAVYDKSGNLLGGPFNGTNFWSGLNGSPCQTFNGGDILVRWDQFASQWWVAQLAYPGPNHICVAVSTTNDALGSYYQYDFNYGSDFPDYPHWGLWPVPGTGGAAQINNGMYITIRSFGSTFSMKILALDRTSLLAGSPGTAQLFDIGQFTTTLDGVEPADLRGISTPAQGSLETYIAPGHPNSDGSAGPVIHLFQTYTDFVTPANSSLTQLSDISVADFDPGLPNGAPQVGGGLLETLQQFGQDGIQYHADYRVFVNSDGSINHDSLLLLHDVNVNSACGAGEQGGERWHEVQHVVDGLGSPPTLYQEGTYGPCDSTYRWMGSLAQDASGDIALGFSATSGGSGIVNDPSVHYTGRLVTDTLGTMPQGEGTYLDSSSAFSGFRWGDYSTMTVDPTDQCTFWYTTMYGAGDWKTRIGSFKFSSCTTGPSGTLQGTVTDASNGNPIVGATVAAGNSTSYTDATGHYSFVLPVGTYDVTASKYGYLPQTFTVGVTDGGNTVQDFALAVAAMTTVSGTVTDASGEGWPLYASIQITAPGFPGATIYTDPVVGSYSISLSQGLSYTFGVNAVSSGYNTLTTTVALHPTFRRVAVTQDFQLTVNAVTCNAPGYSAVISGLYESFDAGSLPPGWSSISNSGGGTWGVNTGNEPCFGRPNSTGGTGPYALVDYCSGYNGTLFDTELRTPSVDMSTLGSAVIRFNLDLYNYGGYTEVADVDVSTNGGSSWTNVFDRTNVSERGPAAENIDITSLAAGQPNVMGRFRWTGLAWFWQVDNVLLGQAACVPQSGGLVVGSVRDGISGLGVNGSTVTNTTSGGSTTSFATPNDPNQDDGFYILFAAPGAQTLDASHSNYADDIQTPTVVAGGAVRQDFALKVGRLSASPSPLNIWIDPGTIRDLALTVSNTGNGGAIFQFIEINSPLFTRPQHNGPYAPEGEVRVPTDKLNAMSTKDIAPAPGPSANPDPLAGPANRAPLAAGDVIAKYPTQIAFAWGTSFDTFATDFWLTNLAALGGDNHDYRYLTNGTKTGDTIDDSSWVGVFVADGAFNSRTGKLWWVNVGGDNCLHEDDPVTKAPTGNKICGTWTSTSQRGVAYDVGTDTYFVGGWNQGKIYHIDGTGAVLDSAQVSLGTCGVSSACISGLTYNTASGHLFVMTNWQDANMCYILDAKNNYAVLGSFTISGFPNFAGAGFEADCFGHIWLVDQATQTIYEIDSGEAWGGCDVPWLDEVPNTGTVTANSTFPVDVKFDATNLTPGWLGAQLLMTQNTPFTAPAIGVNLTILFLDVPQSAFAENFIYGLAGSGVTGGCGGGNYCPDGSVTRSQMAVFIEAAIHGKGYVPPAGFYYFVDVLPGSFGGDFINQAFVEKIVAGCSDNPRNYCPNDNVTRAQMAVFIEKGIRGSNFVPPACTGIFVDVPCPGTYTDFVEALHNDGIAAGCDATHYCPDDPVTRAQMAVFIVTGFQIPYFH